MKPKDKLLAPAAILVVSTLAGCVPADQTIAIVDGQTQAANRELAVERDRTRGLRQTQNSLESQLASLRQQRNSLEVSDPVGNRSEISRLNKEIASMERHLRMQL